MKFTVHSSEKNGADVEFNLIDKNGKSVATKSGKADEEVKFRIGSPKLWSPDSPYLYNITVTMGDDEIDSYTGFRTMSTGMVDGVKRPLINGNFVFLMGTLDQGYWPDGLYLPPNREAMIYDLKVLKDLGFNMVRKHVSDSLLCGVTSSMLIRHCRLKSSRICFIVPVTKWVLLLSRICPACRLTDDSQVPMSRPSLPANLRLWSTSIRAILPLLPGSFTTRVGVSSVTPRGQKVLLLTESASLTQRA